MSSRGNGDSGWKAPLPGRAFLRAVAENSYDSMVVVDATGMVRYQSPSARRIMGYGDQDVVGHSMFDFLHPADRARARHRFHAVSRQPGSTRGMEVRLRRGDGQWMWIQARLTNLLDRPPVSGIVINAVLIQDRKALELRNAAAMVDPHFLYNALHMVAGLVREGRMGEAVEAIACVRSLTEATLGSAEDRLVRLSEEWEWVTDYLALEELRFGPELELDVRPLPPDVADMEVPCRIIQPLVENAVKHGLRNRPGGGRIQLFVESRPNRARVHVIENGQPRRGENAARGFGVGLRTTRQRLALLYGGKASLSLEVRPERSTAVLTLPVAVDWTPIARRDRSA